MKIIRSERRVSGTFRTSMLTKVETNVMEELNSCGMLWLMTCLSVSMSFV